MLPSSEAETSLHLSRNKYKIRSNEALEAYEEGKTVDAFHLPSSSRGEESLNAFNNSLPDEEEDNDLLMNSRGRDKALFRNIASRRGFPRRLSSSSSSSSPSSFSVACLNCSTSPFHTKILLMAVGVLSIAVVALALVLSFLNRSATGFFGFVANEEKPADFEHVFSVLAINDVYNLDGEPSSNGTLGGIARAATIKKQLINHEDVPVLMLLAGDFLSPSITTNVVSVEYGKLLGRQMVDLMNKAGVDYVTFGNHEPDVGLDALNARIRESRFTWISSNVVSLDGISLPGVVESAVVTLKNKKKTKVGIFALTSNSTDQSFLKVSPESQMAGIVPKIVDDFASQGVSVTIGLTHITIDQDIKLAELKLARPINLIVGGHEHQNMYIRRGNAFVPIAKADSEAKTVFIHRVYMLPDDPSNIVIESQLMVSDSSIKKDSGVLDRVSYWREIEASYFNRSGYAPEQRVASLGSAVLDCTTLRSATAENSLLARMLAKAMRHPFPIADAGIINSGSVRCEEVLTGNIKQEDVMSLLPFDDEIALYNISGWRLLQVLEVAHSLKGSGEWLLMDGITAGVNGDAYVIGGQPLKVDSFYLVAMNRYVGDGGDAAYKQLLSQSPTDVNLVETAVEIAGRSADPLITGEARTALLNRLGAVVWNVMEELQDAFPPNCA